MPDVLYSAKSFGDASTNTKTVLSFERIVKIFVEEAFRFEFCRIFIFPRIQSYCPIVNCDNSPSRKFVALKLVVLCKGMRKSGLVDIRSPAHRFFDNSVYIWESMPVIKAR